MKKKVTNEEVGEVMKKLADKIRSDMDFDLRVAHGQMCLAENELVDTFDEKQKELYNDFCVKRDDFTNLAREMFERKI